MTSVLVAIPWRPQPHRHLAYLLTAARYDDILRDLDHDRITVDTDQEPFGLAGCRNEGVRRAEQLDYDVVVLADADTLPERRPLLAAVYAAATDHRVHLPYTEYRSLQQRGTEQYHLGTALPDCDHMVVPAATSGVYVTTPETWWACGGQDERMLGWGMEDVAWLVAHRTLLGAEPVRHDGRVYSLHHESAPKHGPQYDANVSLYHRYLAAADAGDTAAIRALVDAGGAADDPDLPRARPVR